MHTHTHTHTAFIKTSEIRRFGFQCLVTLWFGCKPSCRVNRAWIVVMEIFSASPLAGTGKWRSDSPLLQMLATFAASGRCQLVLFEDVPSFISLLKNGKLSCL